MIAPLLEICLEPVVTRQRRLRRYRGWAWVWLSIAVLTGLILLGAKLSGLWWNGLPYLLGGLAFVGSLIVSARAGRWHPNYTELARRIEEHHPEVRDLLRTAVEQQTDGTGQLSYLQQRVVDQAVRLAKENSWIDAVRPEQMTVALSLHCATLAGLILLLVNLPKHITPVAGFSPQQAGVEVTPGDTSIERGTGLAILARFQGPLPANVTLLVTPDGAESKTIPLTKSLDDPIFGATLAEVQTETTYQVDYDGVRTSPYKIHVFDYPRLDRADANITFPEYTGLAPKRIEDTRRISAVEGANVEYQLQLNKPVAQARLIARDKENIELMADTNRASLTLSNFVVRENATYELQLVDTDGRTNRAPAQFVFQALKNRGPELKLTSPRGDQRVSPIQEVNFQVESWDDFGLSSAGITFRVGTSEPESIVLSGPLKANQKTNFTYRLKLEEHEVKADDLVSYYVWAEDIGPDGQPRRTASDMFFAEVRPFEEIFREDESQQGGQQQQAGAGQQGEETEKLIELQKQVITAAWNLDRKRAIPPLPDSFKSDVEVVHESQQKALEQAKELKEKARTADAQRLVDDAVKAMDKATTDLERAKEKPAALADALPHTQEAYQALLKLQAHEYRVSQSRSQSAQGRRGNRSQGQLSQLELRQSMNKYETENQAPPQQSPAQQEQLQVLNRLKDLARRQQDINERLKELQTALQEAQTEQEKEEIRRRLRRLREDQQQMLEDMDELSERMNKPENQSQMAEARQQLEQTRSQVQQAAESLENNNAPEALSAGTRAQRDLERLRDDVRQKNSSQFTEQMRQMREEARDLSSKQEEVARNLESINQDNRKTLTDSPARAEVLEKLQQQQQGVTNLLQHMTEVTQQAEVAEPLLAHQLYDTYRRAQQGNLNDSLRLTKQLVENSFPNQARPFEQQTRRELQELKKGVESAAQSILGDDTEALRLARSELETLSKQVEQEMSRALSASGQTNTNGTARGGRGANSTNQLAQAGQKAQGEGQSPQPNQNGESKEGGAAREQTQEGAQQAQANAQGQGQPGQQPGERGQQGQGQAQQARNGENGNQTAENAQPGNQGQSNQENQGQGGSGGQGQRGQRGQRGQGNQGQTAQPPPSPSRADVEKGQGQPTQLGQEQPGQGQGNRSGQAANNQRGGNGGDRFFNQGGPDTNGGGSGPSGPLLGEEYRQWSDRMRNVEEMLQEPDLRSEVSTIRERARGMRVEMKRHAAEPQWDLVRTQITEPMAELQNRIQEELARRQSQQALVPIDRDPVPRAFSELVRRYYERLGQGD